jgi:hypothetical protein
MGRWKSGERNELNKVLVFEIFTAGTVKIIYCIQGCNAVYSGRKLSTFGGYLLPPSSGHKNHYHEYQSKRFRRNVGSFIPDYTASRTINQHLSNILCNMRIY